MAALHEIDTCPLCGALPCDWVNNPLQTLEPVSRALEALVSAERAYRGAHDLYGDGSREAGRTWDLMRRASDSALAILTSTQVPA
jgi:hypothetical protein